MRFEDYRDAFRHVRLDRDGGVVRIAIHRDGGPALWESKPGGIHDELGRAFHAVARDPEARVVILTGTGDRFCAEMDPDRGRTALDAATIARISREGRDLLVNLLDIAVPVVGALNGDAFIHAELPLLSDIVVAADGARIADTAHVVHGVVPGDGAHLVWPRLLGPNRGRHFLLTGAVIDAAEAQRIGIVAETVPRDALDARAWAIAQTLAARSPTMLRQTRSLLVQPWRALLATDLDAGLAIEMLALVHIAGA